MYTLREKGNRREFSKFKDLLVIYEWRKVLERSNKSTRFDLTTEGSPIGVRLINSKGKVLTYTGTGCKLCIQVPVKYRTKLLN